MHPEVPHKGCFKGAGGGDTLEKKGERHAGLQMDLFYHAEPFDVACNLADNALEVKDHLDEYLAIRDAAPRREKAARGTSENAKAIDANTRSLIAD